MPLDRIVFDTNIWITYFYNGEFEQLVEIVEDFEVVIYSAGKLENEISSVLQRPKAGDPHLLSIKHVGNIQIISLSAFKKEIRKLRGKF